MIAERVGEIIQSIRDHLAPRKKYIAEFSDDFDGFLSQIAEKKGITKAEVIRNAVASYAYLQKELHPEGGEERHLVVRDGPKILQRIELP